jgi:Cdc6-like AAA superfamily ATPase
MEIWIKHANLIDYPYVIGEPNSDNIFTFDEQKVNNMISEIMFASPTCYLVSGYRGAGKTSFIRKVQEGCLAQNKLAGAKDKKVLFVYSSFSRFESKTYFLRKLIRDFREAATGWEAKEDEGFSKGLNDLYRKTFNEIKNEKSSSRETEKSAEFSLESKDVVKKLFFALIAILAPFMSELSLNALFATITWPPFSYLKFLVYLGAIAWGLANAIKVTLKYTIKETYASKITASSLSDDDITEYDLEHLLDTFKGEKYKIVFVLDELDKIEDTELDQLLREMKPWLVRGKADFILVAGQRLTMRYYTLRDRDDELLASLFAKIIHISPMTEQQLFRIYRDLLVQGVVDSTGQAVAVPLEQFVSGDAADAGSIGNSLIYRSKRIPRSFMNLVRQDLQWRDGKAFLPVPDTDFRLQETKMRILRKLFENLALNGQISETARTYITMQLFRAASVIRDEQPAELLLSTIKDYVLNPGNSREKVIYPYPDLLPVLESWLSEFYQQAISEKIVLRPTPKEPIDLNDPDLDDGIGDFEQPVDAAMEGASSNKGTNTPEDALALKLFIEEFDTLTQLLVGMAKEMLPNYSGDPEKATINELLAAYTSVGILEAPIYSSVLFEHPIKFYRERNGRPKIFKSVFDQFAANNLSFKALFQQLFRGFTERKLGDMFNEISSYFNDETKNKTVTADYRATIPTTAGVVDLLIDFSYVDGEVNISEEEIGRSIALLDDFNIQSGKGNYYTSIIFFRQNRGWDETALSTAARYEIEKIRPDLAGRINYIILSIHSYGTLRNQVAQMIETAAVYSLIPVFDVNKAERLRRSGHGKSANAKLSDTQKGKWGGESSSNYRKVSATVHASDQHGIFIVDIEVISRFQFNTSSQSNQLSEPIPLSGKVTFHLHPVFTPEKYTTFASGGVAKLTGLHTGGPFTIGVSCDNDTTRLELDLHDLSDVPAGFKRIFGSTAPSHK